MKMTSNDDTHTPTPWHSTAMGSLFGTDGAEHEMIGHCDQSGSTLRDSVNAAHIVKCVNAHDELVAALRDLLEGLELRGLTNGWDHDPELVNRTRTVLAKVVDRPRGWDAV